MDDVRARMAENQVSHALVISVNKPKYPQVLALAEQFDNFWATVGVHPDVKDEPEFSFEELLAQASHPKVVAIGETGLDYHWHPDQPEWQRERFRVHIQAAKAAGLPLIIHTRSSAQDTMQLMRTEGADAAPQHFESRVHSLQQSGAGERICGALCTENRRCGCVLPPRSA